MAPLVRVRVRKGSADTRVCSRCEPVVHRVGVDAAHCLSVALGNSALASSTAHFDQAREPLELPAEVVRYTPDEGFAVRFLDLDAGMLPILRVVLVRIKELSEKPD